MTPKCLGFLSTVKGGRVEVLPNRAVMDAVDGLSGYAISRGEFFSIDYAGEGEYLACLLLRQMALAGVLALPVSVLGDHIVNVVCGGSQEQVGRVHARPVIAGVKDPQAIGDGAVGDFPRESMRPSRASHRPTKLQNAISEHGGPSPRPATIASSGAVNLCPESDANIRVHRRLSFGATGPDVHASRSLLCASQ